MLFRKKFIYFLIISQSFVVFGALKELTESGKIVLLGMGTTIGSTLMVWGGIGVLAQKKNTKDDISKNFVDYKFLSGFSIFGVLYALPVVCAARIGSFNKVGYRKFIIPAALIIAGNTLFFTNFYKNLIKNGKDLDDPDKTPCENCINNMFFYNACFSVGLALFALYKRDIFSKIFSKTKEVKKGISEIFFSMRMLFFS